MPKVPFPDRLSALDASFLDLETPESPLHVGWTLRLAGSPPPLAALRRHIEGRLELLPRFRRRVVRPPLGMGDLHWADDAGFDIARHVHAIGLAAPAGQAQLRELAGRVLSRPLDPHRPLWRIYLVAGLQPAGFALVGQVHHALVDGIAAVEVAMLLFDARGGAPAAARLPAAWEPQRPPAPPELAAAFARDRVLGAVRGARAAAGALRRADRGALRDLRDAVARLAVPAPQTPLDRSATRERRVAFAETSLQGARDAGRRHGATINDVLLAAATLALGRALRRRGERPDGLKILVPVSTRQGHGNELGNRVSFLTVVLPVQEPDPVVVLRAVRGQTRVAKATGAAGPLETLARAGDLLPGAARRMVARTAARSAGFNATISNVPGPPVELELMGRPLTAIFPAVPILSGHALTIGAISYRGRLHAGLFADAEVVPDAVDLARDLEAAFDALRVVPSPPDTPWRSRARARRAEAQRAGSA